MAVVELSAWLFSLTGWIWLQPIYNPHSGYGTGLPYLTASSAGLGMGRLSLVGINVGLPDQPAHSAHLTAMQLDFGGYARTSRLTTVRRSGRFGTGGVHNLQLSFARGKGWGFAAGIVPQALQGYTGSQRISTPTSLQYTEKAEGIFTLAYMEGALRWRKLAFGYRLGYLQGLYERQRDLLPPAQPLPDQLFTLVRLQGLQHRIGLLWQDSLSSLRYQVSISTSLSTALSREVTYVFQKNFSYTSFITDTLYANSGHWRQGMHIRGGILIAQNRWKIGAEGGYAAISSPWDTPGLPPTNPRSSWDGRLGAEFIPDPRSPAFYKRMLYQVGAWTARPPFAETQLYGATIGLGWQFPRSPNLVFLAVERGWLPHPLIQETYWQVAIGAVFRELWFIPPRLD
ncbi:MAG: hypothetical protein NZ580_02205 [Bacteroidia bacterium]|nr:hypothetical protein [Bacteroidia bacterium]MDW8235783.1 hypothetical protein [Bacteroidia bacterium]